MTETKTWFITGAGRGMGVDIAQAALAVGHSVVATGRNPAAVTWAVGKAGDPLVLKLDITIPENAEAAVNAAVERFGRIDVLVNNAANFFAGYFEELSPDQIERQLGTSLIGPMNATRAVLPVMRRQRNAAQREWWEGQNGQQAGDPAKLARALVTIAGQEQPPRRFIAGADAIALAEQKVSALQQQIDAFRDLSASLAHEDTKAEVA